MAFAFSPKSADSEDAYFGQKVRLWPLLFRKNWQIMKIPIFSEKVRL